MKKRNYKCSQLKKKLAAKRNNGTKVLVWTLSAENKSIIENDLGYTVCPYLYKVTTRCSYNIKGIKNSLIKELHYQCKRGKKWIIAPLSYTDREALDKFGIQYEPIKYRIYLE